LSEQTNSNTVMLVHGMFSWPLFMHKLNHSLRSEGYRTCAFSYSPRRGKLQQLREDFAQFAVSQSQPLHFVAHSLGGLLALDFLSNHEMPQSRLISLNCPLLKSRTVEYLNQSLWGRALMGNSFELFDGLRPARITNVDAGLICGDKAIGLSRLLGHLQSPNDGAVELRECFVADYPQKIVLPVSHAGSLLSSRVCNETVYFLKHGRFTSGQ